MTAPATAELIARAITYRPRVLLAVLLGGALILAAGSLRLEVVLDASTLLPPHDPDYALTRAIENRFRQPDFLYVAQRLESDLVADATRARTLALRQSLAAVPGVARVHSIVDVPLVTVVPGTLTAIADNVRYLRNPDVPPSKAREELLTSPLYREHLTSRDGQASALQIVLPREPRQDQDGSPIALSTTLAGVRAALERVDNGGKLVLGGRAVVADELRAALATDVWRVPLCALVAMVITAALFAHRLPAHEAASGLFALVAVTGVWGYARGSIGPLAAAAVPGVAISAVSLSLRLSTAYHRQAPSTPRGLAVTTALTRALAASALGSGILLLITLLLCLSPIQPLRDFGQFFLLGQICAWIAAFALGGASRLVIGSAPRALASMPLPAPAAMLRHALLAVGLIAAVTGLPRFIDEAPVVDYLAHNSNARRALEIADRDFGGTLGLDIVLEFDTPSAQPAPAAVDTDIAHALDDGEEAWFTSERISQIRTVHALAETLPGAGKVLSFASVLAVAERVNGGRPLAPFELNVLYKRLPAATRRALLDPYINLRHNQARVHLRMRDSQLTQTRSALLAQLATDLRGLKHQDVKNYSVSGPFVQYARIADRLVPTLIALAVMATIASLGALALRHRTPRAAARVLAPAAIGALGVLGVVGWAGMKIDAMNVLTIAIALASHVHLLAVGSGPRVRNDPAAVPGEAPNDVGRVTIALTVIAGLAAMSTANFVPAASFGVLLAAMLLFVVLVRSPNGTLRS